jgi:hypothetical protein
VSDRDTGLPVEQFIQALTSQLDRAQDAMALKAHVRPLTFAVKDLTLDLRAHFGMSGSVVHITPAGPGDSSASTLHLSLTSITRPMMEENTPHLSVGPDEPTLQEALGNELTSDERRRLEWAGIHTVSQFRELQSHSGESAIEQVASIPAARLKAALERATRPFVDTVSPFPQEDVNAPPLLTIRGRNFVGGEPPVVRIGGEPVPVVRANPREVLVAPLPHQFRGDLTIQTAPGRIATTRLNFAEGPATASLETKDAIEEKET